MKDNRKQGIGLCFALNGLKTAWMSERNFRIHIIVGLIAIAASIYYKLSSIEWIVILLMIHLVVMTELVNTAIERLIDYIKPDWHKEAKIIKDMSAGAVLMSAIISIIAGLIIFLPKLL